MLLVTEFTTERGEAFTVLQLLKRLRRAIIQIDRILFEHQGRIEVLEIDVEEIKDNIEGIKEQLLNTINRVDTLENKVDIVEDTLVNIENNISIIESILNGHGEDISGLNTSIANMTTELNELQDIVNNIPIVQPSLLNGYIKIDGVDVPVFVGGAGGVGGGGAIVADYPQKTVGLTAGETLICEFDVPDYNDTISIYGWLQMYANDSNSIKLLIKGYDENNTEYLLETLKSRVSSAANFPYNHFQYNIMLFKNGYGTAQHTKRNTSTLNLDGQNTSNIELMIRELTDIPKIVRIKMYTDLDYNKPSFILYPFCVYLSKTIGDAENAGSGGSGGSGDTVQTFKTLDVSLDNEDNDTTKNIFKMATSETYLSKYKNFKGRLTFTSSGASIIKLKVNNQDFELYPVRNSVYCIIDYTIDVETLGLVTELIVSWYNNSTRELITTESKYYYPVETSEYLTMDITADISTYGFLHVHNGELIAYPFTGELSQGV